MRTTVFILTMLAAISAGQAHPGHHQGRQAQPRVESFDGLQDGRSLTTITDQGTPGCGGCSLTGGPSGGPNQG